MNTIDFILHQASQLDKRIVLPESDDIRVLKAAQRIKAEGIATPVLIGDTKNVSELASAHDIAIPSLTIVDPKTDPNTSKYADALFEARKHKGMTAVDAAQQVLKPLTYSACMVRTGDADGCVAGAAHTTSDVVRVALQIVGMDKSSSLVSSFFIMEHALPHQAIQGTALFADCALVIDPNAQELAQIAIQSSRSAQTLTGMSPKVALLSFSTAGSASHPNVDKVKQAGDLIKSQQPDMELMVEVQFDAAILPDVLKSKAPDITVAAPANVFIFPDLQSGNIGYKIAQRLGGVDAIGPILQGLKQPVNDLSRGCSIDDIVKLVAVTAVQSK